MKKIFCLIFIIALFSTNCYAKIAGDGIITLAEITAEVKDVPSYEAKQLKYGIGNNGSYFEADSSELPFYIKLDFGGIDISATSISIFTKYGISSGISCFDIEVTQNGQWVKIAENLKPVWKTDTVIAEEASFNFPAVTSKKFRICVKSANGEAIRIDAIALDGKISKGLTEEDILPVYKSVRKGYAVSLPEMVTIKRPDTRIVEAKANWEKVTFDNAGTYTVYGDIGNGIKARAIVDVYDENELFENDIIQLASACGYDVREDGILKASHLSKLMFSIFDMSFEKFPSDYSKKDNDDFYEHMRKYVSFENEEVSRIKAIEAIVSYATSEEYEIFDNAVEFSDIDGLSLKEKEFIKSAVKLGILKTSGELRPNDKITVVEFLEMCFNLKNTAHFKSIVSEDNNMSVTNKNTGSVVSCDEDTTKADVIYIKRNRSYFEDGESFDFSFIDTWMIKAASKQLAFCIPDADESIVEAMYERYGKSGKIAFIDTDNIDLWRKIWKNTNIYSETGESRDSGRFIFGENEGIRIIPSQIKYCESYNYDEGFLFKILWENNSGISAGRECYPAITLKDEKDNIVSVMTDINFDLGELKEGEVSELFCPQVNAYLPGGTYKAYISLGGISGTPEISMPVDLENDGENRYYFADITLAPISQIRVLDFSDNTLKINASFKEVKGEYESIDLSVILKEQGKGIFSLNGDMLIASFNDSSMLNTFINGENCNLTVPFDFSGTFKLRNKETVLSELAGRSFDILARTSVISKGETQRRVIGYGGTMQKLGTLRINEDLTLGFLRDFKGIETSIDGAYSMPEECEYDSGNVFYDTVLCDGNFSSFTALRAEGRLSSGYCTYDFDKHYIQIDFDDKYEVSRFLLGSTGAANHYSRSPITRYSISYFDDLSGEWIEGEKNISIPGTSKNTENASEYSLMINLERKYITNKIRFHISSSFGYYGAVTVFSELIPYGVKIPSEDDFEEIKTSTKGIRIDGAYSMPEECEYDSGNVFYDNVLCDGNFSSIVALKAKERLSSGNCTYDFDKHYIQIDFDDKYEVSRFLLGSTGAANHYARSTITKYSISYFDDLSGEWLEGEKNMSIPTTSKSIENPSEYSLMINLERKYKTSKIRFHISSSFGYYGALTVFSELIPYGVKIPAEDNFGGFEFLGDGARLLTEYEIKDPENTTGIYDGVPNTSLLSDNKTGGLAVVFLSSKRINGINEYEDSYIQMNFDGIKKVSKLLIATTELHHNTSAITKLMISYFDDKTGEWIDAEIHSLDYYEQDKDANHKRMIFLDKEYETSKLRVYVISSFNKWNLATVSELVAYESVGTDNITFKNSKGDILYDFSEGVYLKAETAGFENAEYIAAFYDKDGRLIKIYKSEFFEKRAKIDFSQIPENTASLRTFVIEKDSMTPKKPVLEKMR